MNSELIKAQEEFQNYGSFFQLVDKHKAKSLEVGMIPNPVTQGWLDEVNKSKAYMFQCDLKDEAWYYGHCRNARIAYWKDGRFVYIRQKLGSRFVEEIDHFEADTRFDVFLPYFELKEEHFNIPYIKLKCEELLDKLPERENSPY